MIGGLSAGKAEEAKRVRKGSMVNKENLHEFIPMVMIRKHEEYFTRTRKNSYEEESHLPQWVKAIEGSPARLR